MVLKLSFIKHDICLKFKMVLTSVTSIVMYMTKDNDKTKSIFYITALTNYILEL